MKFSINQGLGLAATIRRTKIRDDPTNKNKESLQVNGKGRFISRIVDLLERKLYQVSDKEKQLFSLRNFKFYMN